MKEEKSIKDQKGNILILIGVILILYALFSIFQWKGSQKELLEKYDSNTDALTENQEAFHIPTLEMDHSQQLDNVEKEKNMQQMKRKQYQRGMMVIDIPKINIHAAIVEGTTRELLKKGPGLYEISPLPTEDEGNVCIAGHRTTYGAWFRHIDTLLKDDEIILTFANAVYRYKVEDVFIVTKNDWSVTEPTGYAALTLTSCHPLRSAKQRIIVRAKLDKIDVLDHKNTDEQ
ncbi:class E sortase [Clostridiaceae bacterium 35-E11]